MSWKRYRVVPVERGFIVERKLYHFSDYEPMRDDKGKIVNHESRLEAVLKIADYKNLERESELLKLGLVIPIDPVWGYIIEDNGSENI